MMSEIKEALGPVLKVLGELGGRFVFTDDEGRQFVVASAEEWEKIQGKQAEVAQKPLPLAAPAPGMRSFVVRSRADELLDRINREIALFQTENADETEMDVPEEQPDDLGITAQEDSAFAPPVGGATAGKAGASDDLEITPEEEKASLRVKFEPLRGDLPPDLQG